MYQTTVWCGLALNGSCCVLRTSQIHNQLQLTSNILSGVCPSPDISHRSLFHRSAAVPSLAAQSPPCHHPTGLYHHCRHVGQALALWVPAPRHLSTCEYRHLWCLFTQLSIETNPTFLLFLKFWEIWGFV